MTSYVTLTAHDAAVTCSTKLLMTSVNETSNAIMTESQQGDTTTMSTEDTATAAAPGAATRG